MGLLGGAGDLVSRLQVELNGVTPIITLLITYLLSPLPLQVGFRGLLGFLKCNGTFSLGLGFRVGFGFRRVEVSSTSKEP